MLGIGYHAPPTEKQLAESIHDPKSDEEHTRQLPDEQYPETEPSPFIAVLHQFAPAPVHDCAEKQLEGVVEEQVPQLAEQYPDIKLDPHHCNPACEQSELVKQFPGLSEEHAEGFSTLAFRLNSANEFENGSTVELSSIFPNWAAINIVGTANNIIKTTHPAFTAILKLS
ncbi:MAG: hypothetical protein HY362_04425 [Candidatus Aenigmarchaeota archaeon]|nr:hypothetical protein [Candidatus Aenigmarchaeota archaeon]